MFIAISLFRNTLHETNEPQASDLTRQVISKRYPYITGPGIVPNNLTNNHCKYFELRTDN